MANNNKNDKEELVTPIPMTVLKEDSNPNFFKIQKCDCCRRPGELHTVCSSLGAVSFGYCNECLVKGAEPIGMIEALMSDVPLEAIRPEYKNNISFYRDGKYILLKDYTKE